MDKKNSLTVIHELVSDPRVEDLLLNPEGVFAYREGRWSDALSPLSAAQLNEWSRKIAEHSGQNLGLTQPTVDAFLPFEGKYFFRAHVAISPLVLAGPVITLRRLPQLEAFSFRDFKIPPLLAAQLSRGITDGLSFLICGSTGSGKSSFLTALLRQVDSHERVLILEDSPELPLPNALSTKLLCRNDRFGFRNGATWDLSHLLFESLRMRPDRLVLGECRGTEAYAVAQALHTGHRGIFTTLHAGSCLQGRRRFEELCRAHPDYSTLHFEELWDFVILLSENSQGQREVKEFWKK